MLKFPFFFLSLYFSPIIPKIIFSLLSCYLIYINWAVWWLQKALHVYYSCINIWPIICGRDYFMYVIQNIMWLYITSHSPFKHTTLSCQHNISYLFFKKHVMLSWIWNLIVYLTQNLKLFISIFMAITGCILKSLKVSFGIIRCVTELQFFLQYFPTSFLLIIKPGASGQRPHDAFKRRPDLSFTVTISA